MLWKGEKKKSWIGIAGHGRAAEKGHGWNESFLGLVTMVSNWSLSRLVGPWQRKVSALWEMHVATSELEHKPSVGTESHGRGLSPH